MTEEHAHLLLVDSNADERAHLVAFLTASYRVTACDDPASVQACLRDHGPVDALLIALDSPGLDAGALIDAVRRDGSFGAVPILALGGSGEAVGSALNRGATLDLPRGFSTAALDARLRLVGGIHLDSAQAEMLAQTDRLATLGRLSAGLAHELNNPAAAAQRGALQLRETVSNLQASFLRLGDMKLSAAQVERLLALDRLARERAATPSDLESLSRSDRESELEDWLVERGVPDAWQLATHLVGMGYDGAGLAVLAADFKPVQLPTVLAWLTATYTIYTVLEELAMGTERMVAIVKSLKAYSHVGKDEQQAVSVNEGLDNTFVMLRSKLRQGITVRRDYEADLPLIAADASELIQVWTNLIDNAADAMDGHGELNVRTRRDGDSVVVEIEDNGPGIPDDIQSRIFDPFFTTKPVGKGTGLGLNIGYEIIVRKHKGAISVDSQPGKTRFEVRLPIHAPDSN